MKSIIRWLRCCAALILPRNVRLILTSRPDDLITNLFGDRDIDLLADAPADKNDVRQYAWARLDMVAEPQRGQFADPLGRRSQRELPVYAL